MTLTKELILSTPVGRELDALVAEYVLGYHWVFTNADVPWWEQGVSELRSPSFCKNANTKEGWLTDGGALMEYGEGAKRTSYVTYPSYSTNIAHTWQVVEHLTRTTKQWFTLNRYCTGCEAQFEIDQFEYSFDALTAPEAICRAALLTLL